MTFNARLQKRRLFTDKDLRSDDEDPPDNSVWIEFLEDQVSPRRHFLGRFPLKVSQCSMEAHVIKNNEFQLRCLIAQSDQEGVVRNVRRHRSRTRRNHSVRNNQAQRLGRVTVEDGADERSDLREEFERDESADHQESGSRSDQIRKPEFVAVMPTQLLKRHHQLLVRSGGVVAEDLMHPRDKHVGLLDGPIIPPLDDVRIFVVHLHEIDDPPADSIFGRRGNSTQQRRIAVADDVALVGEERHDANRTPRG